MNKNDLNAFCDLIKSADKINIFMHYNPDIDAIGTASALAVMIRENFGRDSVCVYDGKLPFATQWVPDGVRILHSRDAEAADLAIAVDLNTTDRMGDRGKKIFAAAKTRIKIDHHIGDEQIAEINFNDDTAAASAQILFEIARVADWKISHDAADCMYAGLFDDTGGFAWVNDARPLDVAAELVRLGAHPRLITERVTKQRRENMTANVGILENAEFLFDGRLAITQIRTADYQFLDDGGYMALNQLRNVAGVEIVAVMKQIKENHVHVSLRSNDNFTVNGIAEQFGGGGHAHAAAFTMMDTLDVARNTVVAAMTDVFK
ncbi:MAG: DHH family phosphoesterase [Rickettsiales bacterium]|jgi:phosphoesterase RecJ-like protein|nr:DHH family phosphoesterase [Rickettsiales bacterium]